MPIDVVRELGPDDLVVDVDIDLETHVVHAERRQRLLRRRLPFELFITDGRPAEEECQEFVRTGDVGSNRLIEPARRREVDRHVGCRAAAAGRLTTTAAAATAVGVTGRRGRVDAGNGSLLVDGVTAAAAEDLTVGAAVDALGTVAPEKDDNRVLHVLPAVVHLARRRRVDPVADEFDPRDDHRSVPALKSRQGDAFAVLEGARLTADLQRHRGAAGRPDPLDANRLKVTAGVAARLDVPLAETLLDVGGGQTEACAIDRPALHLVGRHIRQPLAQLVGTD